MGVVSVYQVPFQIERTYTFIFIVFSGAWGSALPPNLQNIVRKVDEGEK